MCRLNSWHHLLYLRNPKNYLAEDITWIILGYLNKLFMVIKIYLTAIRISLSNVHPLPIHAPALPSLRVGMAPSTVPAKDPPMAIAAEELVINSIKQL